MPRNLAGSNYVAAKIDERKANKPPRSDGSAFHFLVPRSASLDDIVVAFHGSTHCYLLRPLINKPGQYRYLGPVIGLRRTNVGGFSTATLDLSTSPFIDQIPEENGVKSEDEEFILV
jgi:hypothetical protein